MIRLYPEDEEARVECVSCGNVLILPGVLSKTETVRKAREMGWSMGRRRHLCGVCRPPPWSGQRGSSYIGPGISGSYPLRGRYSSGEVDESPGFTALERLERRRWSSW